MKTEQLIAVLATGLDAVDRRRVRLRLMLLQVAGILAAFAFSVGILKLNPQLAFETAEPDFWVRELFCLGVAMTALLAVWRLGLPGRRLGALFSIIIAIVVAVWCLALVLLIKAPPVARLPMILGHTARWCSLLITVIAAAPFIGFVASLRGLAPTRPRWAGAAAGLAAGAVSAIAYSLHCPELQPAFFGTWYLLGMLVPAALGACLGARLLSW